MRRWAPHLTAIVAALLLSEAAGYLRDAMRRRAAATFQVYYWPLDLAHLLLLALLGFLLAAPVWWPRPGRPAARRPDWAVLALYAVPGLLLAQVHRLFFVPWLRVIQGRWMLYLIGGNTPTIAGLLIGFGLALAIAPRDRPS